MEIPVRVIAVTWAVLSVAAAACAPDPPCGLSRCDIREPRCQRAIGKATACLRGQAPADVPIRVLGQERFLAESVAAGEGTVDTVRFARWMAGLGLFGLASPEVSVAEASREQAAWVAAFYDPGDLTITIIDRGRPLDSRGAVTLLVHEYAHALQDRRVGLDVFRSRLASDLDRILASKAVTEGEATLVEDLAAIGLFGTEERHISWPEVFTHWQALARHAAITTELPVEQSLGHFPYPFGLPYAHAAYRSAGFAGIDGLFADPPASSAQVLAGFGVAEPAGNSWAEELGADSVPELPPRFALVDHDRLGGWVLETFVARLLAAMAPGPELERLSGELAAVGAQLRADRLSIFRDTETDLTAACWRLRLSSAAVARGLAQQLAGRGPWSLWTLDRDLILLASDDPAVRQLGAPGLLFAPVPELSASASASFTAIASGMIQGCPGREP
jgi:hypothetical protein